MDKVDKRKEMLSSGFTIKVLLLGKSILLSTNCSQGVNKL